MVSVSVVGSLSSSTGAISNSVSAVSISICGFRALARALPASVYGPAQVPSTSAAKSTLVRYRWFRCHTT